MKIAVLGGGSWGTAVARLLANNNLDTNLYIRDINLADEIKRTRENKKYLKGIILPKNLKISSDLIETARDKDIVVLAVPTSSIRKVLEEIDFIKEDAIIVNLAKGIEESTLMRISSIVKEILPKNKFVALSGPTHAEEVAKDIPSTIVAASLDMDVARLIQKEFSTQNFRIYTSTDLVGVEIGAALKNIIALAAGLSDGLGYGDNTKAALMTRGIYEMNKLAIKMGADPKTLSGLSGIGDLIVTCTSMHSRNRRAGIAIGKGMSTSEASKSVGQVVEGIKTTKSAYELSKKMNIEMPITEALYNVLYLDKNPKKAVDELMLREQKVEMPSIIGEASEKDSPKKNIREEDFLR